MICVEISVTVQFTSCNQTKLGGGQWIMYSVINPQGDKCSCQCLRRERNAEMQQDYQSDNSACVKRLAKEPGALPEAKKSVNCGDTASIETHENSQQMSVLLYSLRELFLHPLPQCLSQFAFGAVSLAVINGIQNSWILSSLDAICGLENLRDCY